MNILVVASFHYQGKLFPTAVFIHHQMMAFVAAGHNVRAIVTTPWGKLGDNGTRLGPAVWHEEVDGIDHIFLRCFSFSNYGVNGWNGRCAEAAARKHMNELLEGFQPDVIHAHALSSAGVASLIKARTGCPLVVTNHGETRCDPPWTTHTEWIAPAVADADALACVSSRLMRQMDDVGVQVPVRTVLNGFRLQAIKEFPPRQELSLNYTGWLQKLKHVDITMRAFAKLLQKYPDAAFTITGSGVEEASLRALAEQLGVAQHVRFLGYLDNQTAIREMAKSRFFVMPSHPEGFGIVYLEAMAAGCITIGTEGEGIADVIRSGENGFLVPPDDPESIAAVIDWCLAHPVEASAIAERGQETARNLTWAHNAEQYIQLFKELHT